MIIMICNDYTSGFRVKVVGRCHGGGAFTGQSKKKKGIASITLFLNKLMSHAPPPSQICSDAGSD